MTNKNLNNHPLYTTFLKKLAREKYIVRFFQVIIFLTFFLAWEIASESGWVDPLIFSSPSRVFRLIITATIDGSLWYHLRITVFETIAGFLIGTLAGVLLAFLLWYSKRFSDIIDPYLVVFNALPKVALGPIIIVVLGPGYGAIITMGAIICVIVSALVVYNGFYKVDDNYIKVLTSFGATKWQKFIEVVFPASLPTIISTFKVNVGLSWVGVIVGEFLVASKGLGYLIVYGFQVFNFTLVLYSLVLIAFLAAIMYQAVAYLEKWLLKIVH
ncbi:NitT/TauT family transport system permease protein [Amphibacillus marinus]|uniref:NitT/TauT family transport system permease protein n=1 Tax=Amphibacillus marinus TaxID=872970 RepID=A0A1H8S1K2_9BACI|nr:ABC transporter permease [Amphibacillus marinus]SEO72416.1 NitT/TauT family transport system permease protein [Amphibacillus marinus]